MANATHYEDAEQLIEEVGLLGPLETRKRQNWMEQHYHDTVTLYHPTRTTDATKRGKVDEDATKTETAPVVVPVREVEAKLALGFTTRPQKVDVDPRTVAAIKAEEPVPGAPAVTLSDESVKSLAAAIRGEDEDVSEEDARGRVKRVGGRTKEQKESAEAKAKEQDEKAAAPTPVASGTGNAGPVEKPADGRPGAGSPTSDVVPSSTPQRVVGQTEDQPKK